jgi:adenylate cyclase
MANLRLKAKEQGTIHPTSDEVRTYLCALLGRSEFDASERNRRFLSYVVEETLEGRADRIKAYNIALAAFNRREDFDPLTDPIVRIEASRLRRSLEHYYLTAGKSDPIRLDIPKGSYSATFEYAHETPLQHEPRSLPSETGPDVQQPGPSGGPERRRSPILAWTTAAIALMAVTIAAYLLLVQGRQADSIARGSRGPAVLVMPFEFVGSDPAQSYLARGLTYEVIGTLTRFDDLFVYGSDTSFGIESADGRKFGDLTPDYILSGSIQTDNSKIRVAAILAEAKTNQYLWSATTEQDLSTSGFAQIQRQIIAQVTAAIAQPYGFVFDQKFKEIATKPAESLASYECVVRFRRYWSSYSDHDFDSVRACLERAVATDPLYARAYSSLALLYVDTYRFGFGASKISFDPLRRAIEFADKAIELEPNASSGYLAKSMTLWFLHDVEGSIQAARHGLDINPYNTDLLADLGLRLAQRARWDEAMPLIEEAYARNPGAPVGYHIATFLHQYMTGDYKGALESANKVQTPSVLYGAVARAIAHAQLGQMEEAREAVADILAIDPHYGDHVREDLAKRNHAPQIIQAVADGLEKAGLRTHAGTNK